LRRVYGWESVLVDSEVSISRIRLSENLWRGQISSVICSLNNLESHEDHSILQMLKIVTSDILRSIISSNYTLTSLTVAKMPVITSMSNIYRLLVNSQPSEDMT
jgi:hypothetical protein